MADLVRITKGQPFSLFVPLVILNTDGTKTAVDAEALQSADVTIADRYGDTRAVSYLTREHYLILQMPADLQVSVYQLVINATDGDGRPFTLRDRYAFAVVEWDFQSNWQNYIVADHIELTDQQFIAGYAVTDTEYEALKAEYRQKIAAAEAEKALYEQKLHDLDGTARETTSQQILTAVESNHAAAMQELTSVTDSIGGIAETINGTAVSAAAEIMANKGLVADAITQKGIALPDGATLSQMATAILEHMTTPGTPAFESAILDLFLQQFTYMTTPQTVAEAVTRLVSGGVTEVHSSIITSLPGGNETQRNNVSIFRNVVNLDLPNCTAVGNYSFGGFTTALKRVVLPSIKEIRPYSLLPTSITYLDVRGLTGNFYMYNSARFSSLRELHWGRHGFVKIDGWDHGDSIFSTATRLMKVTIYSQQRANLPLQAWNPTYVNTYPDLDDEVIDTDHCSTNAEQIDYSVRTGIADRLLSLLEGQTFTVTFHANVYNCLSAETLQVFADKGWTVARA